MNKIKHSWQFAIACTLLFFSTAGLAQNDLPEIKRYTKVPAGYLMVLRQGDSILNRIEDLAIKENIPSANFSGMGFVNIQFGFFDFKTKRYNPKQFNNVELAGMHGTIAWQNGKVSIHSHGTVSGKNFKAYGGHILSGVLSTGSVEILVTLHDQRFERKFEEGIGANVLSVE